MAKPYSNDLRSRVAKAASGDSCRVIAEHYEVAPSTVVKWSKPLRETGSAAPAKFGGHRTCTLEPHRDFASDAAPSERP
jgi:transposase